MIEYRDTPEGVHEADLIRFFAGWPSPPSPSTHLRLLKQSAAVVLAVEKSSSRVVGFISAVSDGVLAAYIPLVEVLPPCQGQGIGSELVGRMLRRLEHLYMVDVLCDVELAPFYERVGMTRRCAMARRDYARPAGEEMPFLHWTVGAYVSADGLRSAVHKGTTIAAMIENRMRSYVWPSGGALSLL